jgi:hypothetical protein
MAISMAAAEEAAVFALVRASALTPCCPLTGLRLIPTSPLHLEASGAIGKGIPFPAETVDATDEIKIGGTAPLPDALCSVLHGFLDFRNLGTDKKDIFV